MSDKTNAIYAAISGGVLWGLARLYATAFSPRPMRKRDLAAALAETTCALITAGIGGVYVVPAVLVYFHIDRPETAGLISVLIGIGLWQSIPAIRYIVAKALPGALAERLGLKPQQEVA